MKNSLSIENVSKNIGSSSILKNINLHAAEKDFLVLLGPSGCGKSTLLGLIAGFDQPTSGSISIDGRDVSRVAPADRDIAMVFQSYALYPSMTVRANMAFCLEMRKIPRVEKDRRVTWAAQILQIDHLLDRKPAELSGGQRQRVAIGRALVREPKLFLFDEPLSNLDAKLRLEMRAELKKLHASLNATVVYVTHDQIEALTLATKIAVMREGVICQVGTPEEIYDKPATKFVAGFLGSFPMNFISGRELQSVMPKRDLGALTVGIRPENVTPAAKEDSNSFEAKISYAELLGSEQLFHLTWNNQKILARTPKALVAGEYPKHWKFDSTNLHFFDGASGERRPI